MGLSTNTTTYAGGAQTFAVNFALGFLSRADVQVRVNSAVDGSGDPVYTPFTWIDDSAISVTPQLTIGDTVEVLRTVSKTSLAANFAANTDVTPANLDISAKQGLMVYQELIDGRVDGTESPIVAGDRAEAAALAAEAAAVAALVSEGLADADKTAAAVSAAAALASENAAAADLLLTNADVVTTNADVVSTNADVVSTNADAAQVALDRAAVAADLALTTADTAATAADRVVTTQNAIDTAAAVVLTNADVVSSAANAAAAVAAYDSFDDRYLGSKASAPTLDNDGAALLTGSLYWNSTSSSLFIYTGSAWHTAAFDASGALVPINNLSDLNNASTARTNLGLGTGDSPTFSGVDVTGAGTFTNTTAAEAGLTVSGAEGNGWGLEIATHNSATASDLVLNGNAVVGHGTSVSYTIPTSGYYRWMAGATSNTGGTAGSSEIMKLTSTALDVAGIITGDELIVSGDGTFTGDVHIRDDLFITGPNPVITLTDNDTADEYTKLQNADGTTYLDSRNGASNGPIIFRGHGGGVTTQYGRFTSTGNFGINDTNPAEKLSVTGNIAATGKVSVVNSSNTAWTPETTGATSYQSLDGEVAVRNTVAGAPDSYASIFFEAGAKADGSSKGTARIAAVKTSADYETDLAFATRAAGGAQREHMRLQSDGKVGIGTSTPSYKMDIKDTTVLADTDGAKQTVFQTTTDAGTNTRRFQISTERRSAGTNFYGTSVRLEANVDESASVNSWMEFMEPTGDAATRAIAFGRADGISNEWMRINDTGLGIGTTDPLYKVDVRDGAIRSVPHTGDNYPFLNVSTFSQGSIPKTHAWVRQDSTTRNDNTTMFISRQVSTAEGHVNPHGLKVEFSTTGAGDPNSKPWALAANFISGTAFANGEAGAALSGVARKTVQNNGVLFGAHVQAKDETGEATKGGLIGLELNIQATGPDTDMLRVGIDLIARQVQGATSPARFRSAIRIRNDGLWGGKWHTGIEIGGIPNEIENIDTGIKIGNSLDTSTGHGLIDDGSKLYGIRANGDYGGGALAMASDQYMEMGLIGGTSRIRMKYNAATDKIEFYKAGTLKASIDMGAGASAGDMN